jgi:hypothetical protein
MIRFLLLQNRAGKTRLAKYYVPVNDSEKRKLEYDVHRLIVTRDPKHTNFAEVGLVWAVIACYSMFCHKLTTGCLCYWPG